MSGDPRQLPPVGGKPLHALDPMDQLNQERFQAYRLFQGVLILEIGQQQATAGEADVRQQASLDLLRRAGDWQLTEEDQRVLLLY